MTFSKTATGLTVTLCLITLLVTVMLLGIYVPPPDSRGRAELSGVILSRCHWDNVPIPQVIDEVNAEIAKSTQSRARLFLASDLDLDNLPNFSLKMDSLPVAEFLRYISELNGLNTYSVAEGIILDVRHQEHRHRSWHKRYSDWVNFTFLL